MADKSVAVSVFALISITGPTFGVIVGGIVITFYGGYNNIFAQKLIMYMGWISVLVIIPIPFTSKLSLFGCLLWVTLFIGGFMMPALMGIMLNSVPENLRASANALAYLAFNFLGYMPSPILYGIISSFVETNKTKKKSRIPMAVILYSVIITSALMTYTIRKKHRKYN